MKKQLKTITNKLVCQVVIKEEGTTMKYKTILADPPWQYGSWGKQSSKSHFNEKWSNRTFPMPYKTMTLKEISSLPISNLADDDCEFYLWTTQKYLPHAFELIEHWGFKYCQTLTWCKTPMGLGQGGAYCPTTEFLILSRKGKMPKVKRIDSTWFHTKRTASHSTKPELFQDLIEQVSYPPRLELFARRKRLGWHVWGNEVESDIEL